MNDKYRFAIETRFKEDACSQTLDPTRLALSPITAAIRDVLPSIMAVMIGSTGQQLTDTNAGATTNILAIRSTRY